jgi:hypothetical protein
MKDKIFSNTSLVIAAALLFGCSDDDGTTTGSGAVQVFVEPEDTIPDGLDPGTDLENIVDGWTIRYSKFIVVFGNFRAHRSTAPTDVLADPVVHVIDMQAVPSGGLVIAEFAEVAAERWDKVGFDLPNATASAVAAEGLDPADFDDVVMNGLTLHIAGQMTKADGQSCLPTDPTDCVAATAIDFDWPLAVGTSYDDCAPPDGDAGFAVPTGGSVQVKPTIHGDHWYFSNITQGVEITERRAQWIADCDLDRDGATTLDELGMVQAADVFPSPTYNLSGAIIPIMTAADYLEAQARTLGDYQGDGECPTRAVLP